MSDLISREALLRKLKEYVENVYECDFDDPNCTADGGSLNPKYVQGLWEAKEIIEDTPTAYDVDAVVEQLENSEFETTEEPHAVNLYKAIDIVKGGGQG